MTQADNPRPDAPIPMPVQLAKAALKALAYIAIDDRLPDEERLKADGYAQQLFALVSNHVLACSPDANWPDSRGEGDPRSPNFISEEP